jgi:transcriptional regulator with XRE-family HTH domain
MQMLNASALPIIGNACWNRPMHTGPSLGAALRAAIKLKGVTQAEVAEAFNVRQPSVAEWIRHGRIAKKHLPRLVDYFSDRVGPEHWGLPPEWRSLSKEAFELAERFDARLKTPAARKRGFAVCVAALDKLLDQIREELKPTSTRQPTRERATSR